MRPSRRTFSSRPSSENLPIVEKRAHLPHASPRIFSSLTSASPRPRGPGNDVSSTHGTYCRYVTLIVSLSSFSLSPSLLYTFPASPSFKTVFLLSSRLLQILRTISLYNNSKPWTAFSRASPMAIPPAHRSEQTTHLSTPSAPTQPSTSTNTTRSTCKTRRPSRPPKPTA